MATYKRFQYYSRDGIHWTDWFRWTGQDQPKWQLKSQGLKNEYKEE